MTDKQLTQRMREAADVLEEAANRFYPNEGLGSIYAHWSSDSLTRVADQWDAEEAGKTTAKDVLLDALAFAFLEDTGASTFRYRAEGLLSAFDIKSIESA